MMVYTWQIIHIPYEKIGGQVLPSSSIILACLIFSILGDKIVINDCLYQGRTHLQP